MRIRNRGMAGDSGPAGHGSAQQQVAREPRPLAQPHTRQLLHCPPALPVRPVCVCASVCVSRVSLYYLCVRVSSVETLVAALSPLPRDTRTSYCSPVATTSGRCGGLRDVVHAQCNGGGAARHGRYWATAGVLQAPTSVCVCMHACVCVCVCVCVCRYWETAGTDKSHIRPWLLALKSKCSGKARARSLLAPPSPLVALSQLPAALL